MTRLRDAHVHVWSSDHSRYPLAPGFAPGDLWLPCFTPQDHERIACAQLPMNLVQMTWYGVDHRYILDLIAADPERFTGTGIVPAICDVSMPRPDRAMLALAEGGIRAFRLRGRAAQPPREHAAEEWLGHEAYQRMFACAGDAGLALSFLCAPSDLPEIGRMCQRFPHTAVILDHCGGVRVRDSMIDSGELRLLTSLSRQHRVFVKFGPVHGLASRTTAATSADSADSADSARLIADTLPLLRATVDAFGADRVLWESDLGGPIQMQHAEHDFHRCLDLVRTADFLNMEQQEQILGGNAQRLLWNR
ncbi:MAG: amidohydrolase family protein [bacterium]|nr:amidohydrolase family protein [bacterium]